MSYTWGKGSIGTLTTNDERVPEEHRSIHYENTVNYYGDWANEYFCLSLYYDAEDEEAEHITVEYSREKDFDKFCERLGKALVIRYEDTPEKEVEDDYYEFVGQSSCHDLVYEEDIVIYTDARKVIRLTIFDIDSQARKWIVEFETRRDRTNFLNILDKTSDVRLCDTRTLNLLYNLLFEEGNKYIEEQNGEKAVEKFTVVLGMYPEEASALERRGIGYIYQKQYQKAIADFTQFISIDDSYEGAYNNRGDCYYHLERFDEAIADYNRAIEIKPDVAMFYSNRGESYLKKKEYEIALEDFTKAIELDETMTEAHNFRGEILVLLSRDREALTDFHRELELVPGDARALANIDNILKIKK